MTETRTIRAMVVADAVLVLIFLVLLVLYLAGGSSGSDGDAEGSSSPTATAPAATSGADGAAAFQLPSGNIACAMSVDGVTCTIADYSYTPPVVPGCTGVTGNVLTLDADGVEFECTTGSPSAVPADAPVLEYGSSVSVGSYTCRSGKDGVQCVDASGVGFRLARASWSELPA